jgi:hypothetical protein
MQTVEHHIGPKVSLYVVPCPVYPYSGPDDGPYSNEVHHVESVDGMITCFTKDFVIQVFPHPNGQSLIWYNPDSMKELIRTKQLQTPQTPQIPQTPQNPPNKKPGKLPKNSPNTKPGKLPKNKDTMYFRTNESGEMNALLNGRQYIWYKKIPAIIFVNIAPIQNNELKAYLIHKKECRCRLSNAQYDNRVFDVSLHECVERCTKLYQIEQNEEENMMYASRSLG